MVKSMMALCFLCKANGVKVDLTAYKIERNNFFRLRDVGKALNFYVGRTAERGVFIETDKPYSD